MTSEQVEHESSRPQFSLRAIFVFVSTASVLLAVGRAIMPPSRSICTGAGIVCVAAGYVVASVLGMRVLAIAFAWGGFAAIVVLLIDEAAILSDLMTNDAVLTVALACLWFYSAVTVYRKAAMRTLVETAFGATWGLIGTLLVQLSTDPTLEGHWLSFALFVMVLPTLYIGTLLPIWLWRRPRNRVS